MLGIQSDIFVLQTSALHEFFERLEFMHVPTGTAEMLFEPDDRPRYDPVMQLRELGPCRPVEVAVDMHKSTLKLAA